MPKLNQVIAVEKEVKSRTYAGVSELHKLNQKPELFNGFQKTYEKLHDDGDDLPSEGKRVQRTAADSVKSLVRLSSELMEVTARKDWTNNVATADVIVGGQTIIRGVPVTHLLFLEKQLNDIHTFIAVLPVLDDSVDWQTNAATGMWVTDSIKTQRTKKTQRPIVLYDATTEHPAQTQLITEDVLAGYWVTQRQSGALAAPDKRRFLENCEALRKAVKQAREQANMVEVVDGVPDVAAAIFGQVFK